ncbi:MAG: hypothetical protein WD648_02520 [Planctomycetaceae bacterium]
MACRTELSNRKSSPGKIAGWPTGTPTLCFFTAALGAFYCYLFTWPLWHTDLWGHLAYGRLICQTGAIPETEPLMPLSAGVPFVDTAWLSQVIGYRAYAAFGTAGLHFLFAATITAGLSLLAWRLYRISRSVFLSVLGLAIFVWVSWQHLSIIRPQLAAMVCQILLLVLLTSRRWSPAAWAVVPVLMACWANLHGSFAVGLAMLGAFALGRAGDVVLRTRSIAAVARDQTTRRLFGLTALSAIAVLLNPYGWRLYLEVVSASSHENLSSLVEWGPLAFHMRQGRAFAVSVLALMFVYRMSPRRVSCSEILQLVGTGLATLWISRMIVWWAPVAAYYLVLHGAAAWSRGSKQRLKDNSMSTHQSTWWLAASMVIAVVCLANPWFSHSASQENLSSATPVGAVDYLIEHPPAGQIFNSYEWGDYLLWAGPPGARVFVASHAHLIPRKVWSDYLDIINVRDGWDATLDRYRVSTIVVDKAQRAELISKLHSHPRWQVEYEDPQAVIFTRPDGG